MKILANGTLVTPEGARRGDVALDGGKIVRLADRIEPAEGDEVVDVDGCWVFPGFIDAHTHLQCWTGMDWTADSFETGTRAAACGGTTTIVDYATADRGVTMPDALDEWHRRADGTCTSNYAFHMALTEWGEKNRRDLAVMRERGVCSFKTYFAYDHLRLDDADTLEVLEALKPLDGILCVHCENGTLVDRLQQRVFDSGVTGPEGHPLSRPDVCEAEAISRLLYIAHLAGDAKVNVVHLSTKLGLEAIRDAKARGQKNIYVETCPQYLALDDGVYYDANWSMAARYVCAPPIRAEENQRALWRGLRRGEIQTISTDHCSFTLAQKDMGREDFTKIPGGLPGVETRGEVVYTRGVAAGRMTVAGMCRALCENPAKLYGLYPRKGVIAAGSDADIVVYDPKASHILTARDMVTKAGYTPFEGLRTEGGIAKVYLRGSLMVEDGRIVGGPEGQYLRRGLCTL